MEKGRGVRKKLPSCETSGANLHNGDFDHQQLLIK